ncbi:MAG: type II 3-dehydroquinate dehydratase [Bacteroidetes bacterium 47-18]|nr:MAG: type II 3-dehydroquinate dehydratase [Bacteroidetes bacterium 47-18]
MKIAVINGPNLNLLGSREPEIYGHQTLGDLYAQLDSSFPDVELSFFQSNHEGELIDFIQDCQQEGFDGIVINPGAYAHTSIALADALQSIRIPAIEVHISNIYRRESFRHHSYTAAACQGTISGLGLRGYHLAIQYFVN